MERSPLAAHSAAASTRRPYFELFWISFLLLFFELACIRWFGSTVVFLTFFTNIVLLATFLGMSVGSMAAASRRDWTSKVLPLLLLAAALACASLWGYTRFSRVMVDVGGQGSPQQVYFGTEYRARDVAAFAIPIELLAGVFFVLIALVFAGVGQAMGRAFNAAPDRLVAYVSNIGGSLAGIAAFAALSSLQTTPTLWLVIVGALWVPLLTHRTVWQIQALLATLVVAGLVGSSLTIRSSDGDTLHMTMWSPYYKIQFTPATGLIETNNIGHQQMVALDLSGSAYQLPHLLNRDAGGPPFGQVLIIGAGSGNDVAAALANGATHVDAVEIDPALYGIGRAQHPDHPYQDPRVTIHIDDGRSFLRGTARQYDLIVYALVDSLVLHSGYSSLRLESFLFTEQAFTDVAARLTPHGVFAVYNFFRQGWIVGRIQRMAERAFGATPLVLSLPHVDRIGPDDGQANRFTVILAGSRASLDGMNRRFQQYGSFWLNNRPALNRVTSRFAPKPPVESATTGWNRVAPAFVDTRGVDRLPTDDWPFLYLRQPRVPALTMRSTLLLGVLSFGILYLCAPLRGFRPNWQMFFLGAGFMLVETKSVVHMALLFGSTWIVNSIVFAAILVMVLTSNLFVLAARPRRMWPYYVLLVAALAVNILVPMSWFLALPGAQRIVVGCAVTFVPIFFAGIVFGTAFRDSVQPDVDFGSNVAGAILGGLAESLSLVIGFNHLLAVALVFYLLSALSKRSAAALPA